MKDKLTPKKIVALVIAALFLVILIQNTQVVTLRLFFWKVEMSRIIFIPFLMLIGFAIGFVVGKRPAKKQSKKEVEPAQEGE